MRGNSPKAIVRDVETVNERISSHLSDISSASATPRALKMQTARDFSRRAFADYRVPDRFPRRRGFEFRGSGWQKSRRIMSLARPVLSRAPTNSRPNSRRVGRVARFCFARRISSRNGGWMKLQRYWIAPVLARRRRISGRLLFCLSAPLLSGPLRWNFDEFPPSVRLLARLRRYEIAVRNKKQLKFVR